MAEIDKLEIGVEVKECKKCEYKLRCEECEHKNEKKSVINALKVLKDECEKREYCEDCPLYEVCDGYFGNICPDVWKIPEQVKGEENENNV